MIRIHGVSPMLYHSTKLRVAHLSVLKNSQTENQFHITDKRLDE